MSASPIANTVFQPPMRINIAPEDSKNDNSK